MCKKALILQTYQKTSFVFDAILEECSDFIFQCEENLADAIKQLMSCQFDYIICCEHLPDDALSSLHELKLAYDIPFDTQVLAFSQNPERSHKEKALALGIIDFHDIKQVNNYDDFFQPVTPALSGHILLVEENEKESARLISLFEQNGHIVSHFVDINLAHNTVKNKHYDLFVVDLFSLSGYLNKKQLIKGVNTLVLSHQNKTEVTIDLLQLGVTEVINKPIFPKALLLRVEHILKTNQLHQDELADKTQHLLELSVKDALTGAYNRRYLEDVIEQRVNFLRRHNEPFSVLLLDIDNFKQINDTKGHKAGDKLLVELVTLIQHFIRNIDCICRYGGEEFVIVLAGCSVEAAMFKAEQIRKEVEDLGMTISLGVAAFDDASQNLLVEEHIHLADLALYQAKKAGKNQVVLYSLD
jgi:diguanylate cyclase (GGDEF)-like protein